MGLNQQARFSGHIFVPLVVRQRKIVFDVLVSREEHKWPTDWFKCKSRNMIGKLPSMILFDALHWMRPKNTNMDFRSADFDDCGNLKGLKDWRMELWINFKSTRSTVNSAAVRLFLSQFIFAGDKCAFLLCDFGEETRLPWSWLGIISLSSQSGTGPTAFLTAALWFSSRRRRY